MKAVLRRVLGPSRWASLADVRRRARDGVAESIGRALAAPAASAPTPVRLAGLRTLRPQPATLDFPDTRLVISIESAVEWDLRRFPCRKEPETVAWLRRTLRPGDLIFDVGANVGAYSLIAAALEPHAKILAFEPVAATYASLCENIALNELSNRISPLAVALGDRQGLLSFGMGSHSRGAAGHGGLHATGADAVTVLGATVDGFLRAIAIGCPTHLKIDVDGSEHLVLAGAIESLRDPRMRTVLVEVDVATSRMDQVGPVLEAAGFIQTESHQHDASTTHNVIFERETETLD